MKPLAPMTAGKRYMILFRRQPSTSPFIGVLDYLDATDTLFIMSGRPTIGTQQIPKSWVFHVEEVPAETDCLINVRLGASDVYKRRVMRTPAELQRLAERHYEIEQGGL